MCAAACYLSSTLNMAMPRRPVAGERDDVSERGLHRPTKPTQELKLFQTRDLKFSTPGVQIADQCRVCAAALHGMFLF